ncbi:MAG: hypothetical protein ABW157_13560 [Candidatus Thiodiazotropha sp. LLP2]
MGKFYTEKETEAYLQDETRILTLPNGRKESVTTMHMTWRAFDRLDETKACSCQELIKRAYDWYKRDGKHDFTTYFWNLVSFIHSEMKVYCNDFTERQIAYREKVLASLQNRARNDFNAAHGDYTSF